MKNKTSKLVLNGSTFHFLALCYCKTKVIVKQKGKKYGSTWESKHHPTALRLRFLPTEPWRFPIFPEEFSAIYSGLPHRTVTEDFRNHLQLEHRSGNIQPQFRKLSTTVPEFLNHSSGTSQPQFWNFSTTVLIFY